MARHRLSLRNKRKTLKEVNLFTCVNIKNNNKSIHNIYIYIYYILYIYRYKYIWGNMIEQSSPAKKKVAFFEEDWTPRSKFEYWLKFKDHRIFTIWLFNIAMENHHAINR